MIQRPSRGISPSRLAKDLTATKDSDSCRNKSEIKSAKQLECRHSRAVEKLLWHEICSVLQAQEIDAVKEAIGNTVVEDNEILFREILALEDILVSVNNSTQKHLQSVPRINEKQKPNQISRVFKSLDGLVHSSSKVSKPDSEIITSPKKLQSKDQLLGKKDSKERPSTPDSSARKSSPLRKLSTPDSSTNKNPRQRNGLALNESRKPTVKIAEQSSKRDGLTIGLNPEEGNEKTCPDSRPSTSNESTQWELHYPLINLTEMTASISISGDQIRDKVGSSKPLALVPVCPNFDPCLLVQEVKPQLNVFDIDEVKEKLRDAFASEHILLLNDVETLTAILDKSTELYSSVTNTPRTLAQHQDLHKLDSEVNQRIPSLRVAKDFVKRPVEKVQSLLVAVPNSDKKTEERWQPTLVSENVPRQLPYVASKDVAKMSEENVVHTPFHTIQDAIKKPEEKIQDMIKSSEEKVQSTFLSANVQRPSSPRATKDSMKRSPEKKGHSVLLSQNIQRSMPSALAAEDVRKWPEEKKAQQTTLLSQLNAHRTSSSIAVKDCIRRPEEKLQTTLLHRTNQRLLSPQLPTRQIKDRPKQMTCVNEAAGSLPTKSLRTKISAPSVIRRTNT